MRHEETALCGLDLVGVEHRFQVTGGDRAGEVRLKRGHHFGDLLAGLMNELNPKIFDARLPPLFDPLSIKLRFGPEDRVAATHIGHDGVFTALVVFD